MKKLLILAFSTAIFTACKKDETTTPTTPNNNGNNTNTCKEGNICFTMDGADISKSGSGYVFADTFIFVKYEEGAKQLSIDIFGQKTGSYTVTDIRKMNNARIYYFKENNDMYMAEKGNLSISDFSTDFKLTGSFSATLYKYNNDKSTFDKSDSVTITNGSFSKVQLFEQK